MELARGMKFTSKWFVGITEVLDINKQENTLTVEIDRGNGSSWQENWNLEHTIWGFERSEYRLINPPECNCNVGITNVFHNGNCIKCKNKVTKEKTWVATLIKKII